MNKNIFANLHYLIIYPTKFYRESIKDKNFRTIDLLLLVTVFITLITVLYFFESKINNQYGDWLRVSVSLTGFIIGFSLSFVFRVYLITIILNRMGLEVEFNNIGMVVAFAMITNIFMFLILIFIQTAAFDTYIGVIFNYTGHK